ncbi:unnamed protein product [Caenorhabditis brenneri]
MSEPLASLLDELRIDGAIGKMRISSSARTAKFGPTRRLVSVETYCREKYKIRFQLPNMRCVYFIDRAGELMAVETLCHVPN